MPATGFILPTARTVDAGSGTWTNDANVLADDGAEATFSLTTKNATGRALRGQTFGFDSLLPADAVIDKVEIRAEWRVNSTGGIGNLELQAFVSGVAVGSVNTNSAEPTTLTTQTFDITAARAWTRADLLNGVFELRTWGRNGNSATDPSYRWDHIAVQVTYSQPAPAQASNTFEGGTDGTTITTGNSGGASGDAFQSVLVGAGATNRFSAAHARGGLAAELATDATANTPSVGWNTLIGTRTSIYYRFYVYFPALPTVTHRLCHVHDAAGTTQRASMTIRTDGLLQLLDAAGSTLAGERTTVPIATGAWARVEVHFVLDAASGEYEVRLFQGAKLESPVTDWTDRAGPFTGKNLGGAGGTYRAGVTGTPVANVPSWWLDDFKVDTEDWVGPSGVAAAERPAAFNSPYMGRW